MPSMENQGENEAGGNHVNREIKFNKRNCDLWGTFQEHISHAK